MKLPTPLEKDIQDSIVTALNLAGFQVLHTSAPKQRGSSGVSYGIPDLLIYHTAVPYNMLGIEVKRPGGKVRPHQQKLADSNVYHIAYTDVEALTQAHSWLCGLLGECPAVEKSRRTLTSFISSTDAINRQGS